MPATANKMDTCNSCQLNCWLVNGVNVVSSAVWLKYAMNDVIKRT